MAPTELYALNHLSRRSRGKGGSTFFDGHPALQDELTGTEKGTNVVFLHTTVDDGDHFQPRKLSGLREITRTFRSEK